MAVGGFDERHLLSIVLEIAGATALARLGQLGRFRSLNGFRDGFDELDRRCKCLE